MISIPFSLLPPAKLASPRIQCAERGHIFCIKLKIKDIEVFFHSLNVRTLGDDDNILLIEKAQSYLCHALPVLRADFL